MATATFAPLPLERELELEPDPPPPLPDDRADELRDEAADERRLAVLALFGLLRDAGLLREAEALALEDPLRLLLLEAL